MRKMLIFIFIILFACVFMSSCLNNKETANTSSMDEYYINKINELEGEIIGYEEQLAETKNKLKDAISQYESCSDEYNGLCDEIDYYKSICKKYGYCTYEEVYHFGFVQYFDKGKPNTLHKDYFCDSLNRSNIEEAYGVSVDSEYCPLCGILNDDNVYDYCYVDSDKMIVHNSNECLKLETNDYKIPIHKYYITRLETALKNGYKKCNKCLSD